MNRVENNALFVYVEQGFETLALKTGVSFAVVSGGNEMQNAKFPAF